MELGFEKNKDILNIYKNIHFRKSNDFNKLLGNNISNDLKSSFWDIIVITAIDEQQKQYYELVINEKIKDAEIPSFIKYLVIADPVGNKIGCGGSTIYVLSKLKQELGHLFNQYKILLLHAGGYSKRLPNHSTTGKIFASIPYSLGDGGRACTMLEIKLIMLIDFAKKMKPGVFLACSDDIELFESEGVILDKEGFTAIAQPGTLDIGTGHGVFILEDLNAFKENDVNQCQRFIHKPTKQRMKDCNAILENGLVLMDSCYYFDHNMVSRLLLKYYSENQPIQCEIDAYSDFLQPLGPGASADYFESRGNVSVYTDQLAIERKKLFEMFQSNNVPLYTIPYIPSMFIHIGTCQEYLEHFTENFPQLDFKRIVYSDIGSNQNEIVNKKLCIIHSNFQSSKITIQEHTIIEYCSIVNCNQVTIESGCILADLELHNHQQPIHIPSNTFIQTLCVSNGGYVTIIFGIDDNLKSNNNIKICSKAIQYINNNNNSEMSLWNTPLFPICPTPKQSLLESLELLKTIQSNTTPYITVDLSLTKTYSIDKCLQEKDLKSQFKRRQSLTKTIKQT
ncbi:fucose-1-phosphate guanylyltransferase [Tieghemostelium lacteum]|uniref:Fucose-1-phosphate guanylyltransferase n=1 Tax=Tieghemostelium lacteum TaxID=361077 RepID=A0A151ZA94_TIELA|nr:fucose-1-phosphate guanylyltransferase [Tieghemostelium lacteum]|eukprot:KYQ90867.1 fucose-1-phosphate guanylyltransferase [Tieghemostelium lacteum]